MPQIPRYICGEFGHPQKFHPKGGRSGKDGGKGELKSRYICRKARHIAKGCPMENGRGKPAARCRKPYQRKRGATATGRPISRREFGRYKLAELCAVVRPRGAKASSNTTATTTAPTAKLLPAGHRRFGFRPPPPPRRFSSRLHVASQLRALRGLTLRRSGFLPPARGLRCASGACQPLRLGRRRKRCRALSERRFEEPGRATALPGVENEGAPAGRPGGPRGAESS